MKKLIATVLLCLVSVGAYAQNQDWIEDDYDVAFSNQIQTYYQHPNTTQALHLYKQLIRQPDFDMETKKQLNTWVWGAQILQQQPKQTKKWCKDLKKEFSHINIAPLFQYANTDAAKRCLKSLKLSEEERELLAQLPDLSSPLDREVQTEVDLDILWSTFFATGNPQVLYKIVDFSLNNQLRNQNLNILRLASRWSLQANMNQDEEIRKIVLEYVQSLNPSQQKFAKTFLNLS